MSWKPISGTAQSQATRYQGLNTTPSVQGIGFSLKKQDKPPYNRQLALQAQTATDNPKTEALQATKNGQKPTKPTKYPLTFAKV